MNDLKATGFEFYETLRYLLPGLLSVFLFGQVFFLEYWDRFSFSEKVIFGVLVGFLIQSFGMHKWVLGTTKMRKEFQKNCEELLPEIDDFYIRVDVIFLTINAAEEQYVKKYFGLGAFKLDMVQQQPGYSNSQVRNRLKSTAKDLGAPGWDQYYGYGFVDASPAGIPGKTTREKDGPCLGTLFVALLVFS